MIISDLIVCIVDKKFTIRPNKEFIYKNNSKCILLNYQNK